jgi:glycosyltransferase involved in cell wall biosynthesis
VGDAATFVAPDDPAALTDAVNALLRDPLRRASVARRAYDTARRYHPVAMADRYLAAYRGLTREALAA